MKRMTQPTKNPYPIRWLIIIMVSHMLLFLDTYTFPDQVVGVIFHKGLFFCFRFWTRARNFFRHLVRNVEKKGLSLKDLKRVYYLQGRGSFSTNRSVITAINILSSEMDLVALDVNERFDQQHFSNYKKQVGHFLLKESLKTYQGSKKYLKPRYEHEPNISRS